MAKKPAKKAAPAKRKKGFKKDGTAKLKRGKSAFMFFSIETRPKVVSENPDLAFGEVAKHIGQLWKELEEPDRKPFQALAAKDKVTAAKANEEAAKKAKEEEEAKSSSSEEEEEKSGSEDEEESD